MDNSNFSNYQNQNLIGGENQIPSQEEIENNNNPISTNSNSSSQQKLSNNDNIYNYEKKEIIPLEVQQYMNVVDKPGIIDSPKRSCCCDCCCNCCHECCISCDECCSSQACKDVKECLEAVGVCCQALNALASCQIF